MGAIVTTVSGTRLPDYISSNVFARVGMRHSYTSVEVASREGLAVGYRFLFGRPMVLDNIKHHPPIAAGGLIASAEDLALYMSALMDGGASPGNRLLKSTTLERLFKSHDGTEKPNYYGMGWQVASVGDPPVKIISHGGDLDGFTAEIAFRPDERLALAILINGSSPTKLGMNQLVHGEPGRFLRNLPPSNLADRHPMYYMIAAGLWLTGLSAFAEAASVVGTFLLLGRWRRGNMPARTRRIWVVKWWLPLVGHLLIAFLMLWLLPQAVGVGPRGIIASAPDWGSLGVGTGIFALVWGMTRSVIVGRRLVKLP